jgi:predicted acyl esterase
LRAFAKAIGATAMLVLASPYGATAQSPAASAQPAAATSAQFPDVLRRSIYVPVRDGTRLAVNIYRPAVGSRAAAGKLPVVFAFTPYRARFTDDKGAVQEAALGDSLALRSLIRAGYVVAVADIRGKGASFGARRGFQDRTEARDGYDLVEWLARQPFASGRVGMIGCSYLGGSTMHTASTVPPSLKAIFVGATELDKFAFVANGGITAQFNTRPDENPSVDLASVPVDADRDGAMLKKAVAEHAANTPMAPLWYSMPYRDSVSPLTGNAFWREVAIYPYFDRIRASGMATYFWGNWHDEPTGHMILSALNVGGHFLAGPGDHCATPPGFDFPGEVVRYFDYYLKGASNGFDRQPRATYWRDEPGGGRYVQSANLPGTTARPMPMFLASGSGRTGTLGFGPGQEGSSGFTVDYDLPSPDYFAFWPGDMSAHGLGFTTAPLARPLTLEGFPAARLTVSADNPAADLFVYLDEIAPGGQAKVISFGRLRLSYRKPAQAPYNVLGLPWQSGESADALPLAKGERVPVSIAFTPVSRVIAAGSRLRLTIAGADPRQRNLQQIRISPAPRITVYSGGRDASRIELPIVE